MATVFERVQKIIIDRLGVQEEQVQPATAFLADLKADSLDLLDIVICIEEEFAGEYEKGEKSFEISDESAKNIVTVQCAVDYLKSMGILDR